MIWTWNGNGFEYITDVLGVAPLGASSGDGQYFPVDHDEYIQIPGSALKAATAQYEVRITEELSEVAYLDHVRLIAVDHPGGLSTCSPTKNSNRPPFPEFRLFGVKSRAVPCRRQGRRRPRCAGQNVLARSDRTYPDAFRAR